MNNLKLLLGNIILLMILLGICCIMKINEVMTLSL